MSFVRIILAALVAASLTACVSMPAPTYQPSVDTSQALLASAGSTIHVGHFTAAEGVENTSLGVRGSRLEPGRDGTYAGYLRDALITELKAAGRHDDASGIHVTGVLTDNTLGSGAKTGRASIGAHFRVERDGGVVLDRTLQVEHEWESSFMGAIAIPAAFDNYATTVQKLLQRLFTDPEFIAVTAPAEG
ncbi:MULTISPECIES: hypothetical protein [unclassified Luteimonas]